MRRTVCTAAALIALSIPVAAAPAGKGGESSKADEKDRPLVSQKDIDDAIESGIAFLLSDQNQNGSWGSPHQTKGLNIYAPVPGSHHAFRCAVTAMCVSTLIEAGFTECEELKRGEKYLIEELPKVRRATPTAIYNVWTHGYGIQALARMHERAAGLPQRQDEIIALIEQQIELLARYESVDGGWGYYDFRAGTKRPASSSISFTTATILVALHEAKQLGASVPEDLVQRALDAVQRQRKKDNSYLYGEYLHWRPMYSINRPGGSLGRSQACNIALRFWGDTTITDAVLEDWLARLAARNMWLDMGRKRPIPHESWFAVAGYFFYYGHYYAAVCIEQLPPDKAIEHKKGLAGILLALQESDGSWWDFPFYNYHRQYGTAFAVMSLLRCRD